MTKDDVKPVEVVVKRVVSSEFLGLIMLEDFLFSDGTNHVVLPSEDKLRRQFTDTKRLHIPYHNIVSIEEFVPGKPDVKNLPFLRSASSDADSSVS